MPHHMDALAEAHATPAELVEYQQLAGNIAAAEDIIICYVFNFCSIKQTLKDLAFNKQFQCNNFKIDFSTT